MMTTAVARLERGLGGKLLDGNPNLVPVPLHPARLRARRYNQSALMTARLAKISGLEWMADGLDRTRRTRSQGPLGGAMSGVS